MRILFIWPAVENAELGNFLPLGFGYLAANLPKGHEVRLWDGVLARDRGNEAVIEEIRRFQPELIGLSLWHFNMKAAREVVRQVRQRFPATVLAAGGPSVSGYGAKTFAAADVDYAFVGEGEKSFGQLVELLARGKPDSDALRQVDGLIRRTADGGVACNPPRWGSLDELSYCDYDLVNLNGYLANGYRYGIHSQAKRTAPILTTRGCPYGCEYCGARHVTGRTVRTRPVESVAAEIKHLHERFQIDGFNIVDDNFTFHLDYAKQVCRAIQGLGLKGVSFCSPNGVRAERLDEELLHLMKQAGWEWLFIAPESGSERTLANMRKGVSLRVVEEKVKMIKAAGLRVFGFFMIGYPGETRADIRKTIHFACRNDFDLAVFTCFQPLAGTPAYEKLLRDGEIAGPPEGLDYFEVSYAPKGFTIAQLKLWRFWALLSFYLSSPGRLIRAVTNYSPARAFHFLRKLL